jgi:redox-sensitive bicupin YhaK (pirin superfamily)
MSSTVLHKANTRGHADFGWLDSHHSFSFGHYYDPSRVHFGALRVLNDDVVAAGMGFGKHPHDNMEIISIPLEGELEHQDSMGTTAIIKNGDVQVMSAGTGLSHSEYNHSKEHPVKFLQIWIIPNKKNVSPRYDQISLRSDDRKNKLQQIVSPDKEDAGVWIHQNAWLHLGTFDKNNSITYKFKSADSGVYAFLLKGNMMVKGHVLNDRDALGIWDTEKIDLESGEDGSEILLIEVPMKL